MFDKGKLEAICSDFDAAMNAKEWTLAAELSEALERTFRDQKMDTFESVSDLLTYLDMLKLSIRYLSYNNFFEKAWENYEDARMCCEAIDEDRALSMW